MFLRLLSHLTSPSKTRFSRSSSARPRALATSLLMAAFVVFLGAAFCPSAHAIASPATFSGFQRPLNLSGAITPYGVAFDAGGNLYVTNGTTGTLSKYAPLAAGGYGPATTVDSVLASPVGVTVASNGNVFVAGGLDHTVYEIKPDGSGGYGAPTVVGTGLGEPVSVALDGYGNLLVVDYLAAEVLIFKVSGTGFSAPTVLPAPVGGWNQPVGLAVDSRNNAYVADEGLNAAYRMTSASNGVFNTPTQIGSSIPKATGVALDGKGNVFVSQITPTSSDVFKIAPDGTQSIYASGFADPLGMTFDASGALYIADIGVGVWEVTNNFGSVNVGSVNAGNSLVTANFNFTNSVTLGSVAILTQGASGLDFGNAGTGTCAAQAYVAGQSCTVNVSFAPIAPGLRFGAVVLTDNTGSTIAEGIVQGNGVAPQAGFLPGTASYVYGNSGALASSKSKGAVKIKLPALKAAPRPALGNTGTYPGDQPNAIVVDAKGNLYVTDTNFCELYKSADNGATWTTIPNAGACPAAVAVDGAGNVFFSDVNFGVYGAYLSNGIYNSYGLILTPAISGIAVDSQDNLYLTSNTMFTFGGGVDGVFVAVNANGSYPNLTQIAGAPDYLAPAGIAVDATGNLFVADYSAGTITEVIPQSNGSYTEQTVIRGLDSPTSVQVDPQGNLYIVDLGADTGSSTVYIGYPNGQNNSYWLANSDQYSLFPVTNSDKIKDFIWWAAVAANGNIYMTDHGYYFSINELDVVDPPTLEFGSAVLGNISPNSPQDTLLVNTGNASLSLMTPTSGTNPSISTHFLLNSSGTTPYPGSTFNIVDCTLVTSTSTAASILPDSGCALPVSFQPLTVGTINGTLVLTDNSLNQVPTVTNDVKRKTPLLTTGSYATQTINLTGNGLDAFSIASTGPIAILVAPGASATYTFTVTPVLPATTFPQDVVLSASGGPIGTTYVFSQGTITAGSGPTTVTLTVTAPVTTVVQNVTPQQPGSKFPAPLALALLLLPLAAKMRKVGKGLSRMAAVLLLLVAGMTATVGLSGCYSKLIPATYVITVTGNSGAVNHSATVLLSVK